MSPSVLLIVPHVVDDIGDDHGEPSEHGDKHGHVGGLVVKVTEIDSGVQHLDDGLACVLLQHRRVAAHLVDRLRVQLELAQHLLQGALAVPGVVGQADAGVKPGEGLLGHALDEVVGEVQHAQAIRHPLKRPGVHRLDAVPRQVQLLQPRQVPEGLVGDLADVVGGEQEGDSVMGKILGDALQIP